MTDQTPADEAGSPEPIEEPPEPGSETPQAPPVEAPPADAAPAALAAQEAAAVRAATAEATTSKSLRGSSRLADAIFGNVTRGAGIFILLLMAAIAAFLIDKAVPAISANTSNWLTAFEWNPDSTPSSWGIGALLYGTLLSSLIALLFAVPTAIGTALFITQYAPKRVAQLLGYIVDLLAAVPSVIYGLWGLLYFTGPLLAFSGFLNRNLSFIPIFGTPGTGQSIFAAGILLAIMVLPIVAALAREVFLQTPHDHVEAAYALGATRWEMIKYSVLPYGKSGLVSATVLGLGRALGETIALAMMLPVANYQVSKNILGSYGNTIAANIANYYSDSGTTGREALIASGLVLFTITLLVNFLGRAIVRGGKQGARA